jgi:hypothetical protein
LLETSWGTLCDLDGNLMGTHKEQQKNKRGWVWVYIFILYWLVGRCTQICFCYSFLFITSSHL